MKAVIWLLSLPHLGVSILQELIDLGGVKKDIALCMEVAQRLGSIVPATFVDALILAEDHRSNMHLGIDPIAMIRAFWIRVSSGQVQGASTIEQQYVRVITNRYERTFSRKLREQVLALMLSRRIGKRNISSAYLSLAFYGSDTIGIEGLRAQFGNDLSSVDFNQALQIVAQLKYPRPQIPTACWHSKMETRLRVLLGRIDGAANNDAGPLLMALPHHGSALSAAKIEH